MEPPLGWRVNAFTVPGRPFSGNPAFVVLLPPPARPLSSWLEAFPPTPWMQALATEMALSETAFVAPLEPPRSDAAGDAAGAPARFALRWMTPAVEVDLCGHATLAAAHAVREAAAAAGRRPPDTIVFTSRSGQLAVTAVPAASVPGAAPGGGGSGEDTLLQLDFPATPPTPLAPGEARDVLPALAAALRLPAGALDPAPSDGGLAFAGRSPWDLVVHLRRDLFDALPRDPERLDLPALGALAPRGVVVTASGGCPPASPGASFVSRWFGPQVGVPEDPVTGSAHCALAPYWRGVMPEVGSEDDWARGGWLLGHQASSRGGQVFTRLGPGGARVLLVGRATSITTGRLAVAPPPAE